MKIDLKPTFYPQVTVTADEIESYHQNGYLIAKNLIPMGDIAHIRQEAIDIYKQQLLRRGDNPKSYEEFEKDVYHLFRTDLSTFMDCGKHMQHTISLHRLSVCPQIIDVLKRLGLSFITSSTRPVLFMNSKHLATKDIYHTVPAHQDVYSTEGSANSAVVWLPLTNLPKELGPLEIVPGSHKHGLLTSRVEEGFGMVDVYGDKDFISTELEPGDALFFSSYLVHRSGNNTTNSIRWSAHVRYNDMNDSDFIDKKYPHPYIYKPKSK